MGFLSIRATSVALVIVATMGFCSTADAAPAWTSPATLGLTGRENGAPDVAVAPNGKRLPPGWVVDLPASR
jgi:hypothetical protein